MDSFELIAGISSIIGLFVSLLSLFLVNKTLKIVSKNKIEIDTSKSQNIKIRQADNNNIIQSGNDVNIFK